MTLYIFSSLIAAVGVFALGIFVLLKDSTRPLNRIFFLYCMLGSLSSFTEFGYRQAESYQMALLWFRASSLSLVAVPLQVHFVMLYTKRAGIFKHKITFAIFYVPPLIFLLLDYMFGLFYDMVEVSWGWSYVPKSNLATHIFNYWYTGALLLAFALSFSYFLRTKTPLDRSRATFVTLAIGVIVLFSFLSEPGGLFSILGIDWPELSSFGFMLACLLLTYAIWRWELFDISPSTAAESIVAAMSDALFLVDRDGLISISNQASLDLLGYRETELQNLAFEELIDRNSIEDFRRIYAEFISTKSKLTDIEIEFLDKENRKNPISLSASPILDRIGSYQGVVFVGRDLTARKRAEQQIKTSLHEKETLLREIHHRVKNNMQVITSLLVLQSRHTMDERAMMALQESRSRIQSMAIVHEMLYQSEGLSQVDFESYTKRLVDQVRRAQAIGPEVIEIKYAIAKLSLDIDAVVNCGLIINELVTNSYKHAFPDHRSGQILIELAEVGGNKVALKVKDNGIGLPPKVGLDWPETLGMQLVNVLVNQMGGTVTLDRKGGTEVTIVFEIK